MGVSLPRVRARGGTAVQPGHHGAGAFGRVEGVVQRPQFRLDLAVLVAEKVATQGPERGPTRGPWPCEGEDAVLPESQVVAR